MRERGEPEYYIQEHPKMTKRGREEGRGGGRGLRSRQTPMSLDKLGPLATYAVTKWLAAQTAAVTYRHEPSWNSIIRQILANNFGISLLRSLRAALYPGSSRALTGRDTLIDMHTELTAVPHAGLGYHFLRAPVRTIGSWGSARGSEAKNSRPSTAIRSK